MGIKDVARAGVGVLTHLPAAVAYAADTVIYGKDGSSLHIDECVRELPKVQGTLRTYSCADRQFRLMVWLDTKASADDAYAVYDTMQYWVLRDDYSGYHVELVMIRAGRRISFKSERKPMPNPEPSDAHGRITRWVAGEQPPATTGPASIHASTEDAGAGDTPAQISSD